MELSKYNNLRNRIRFWRLIVTKFLGTLFVVFTSGTFALSAPICVEPIQHVNAKAIIAELDSSISIVEPVYKIADEAYYIIAEQEAEQSVCLFFGRSKVMTFSTSEVPKNSNFVFLNNDGSLKHISNKSNYFGKILAVVHCH
jgi:hypothetical protein